MPALVFFFGVLFVAFLIYVMTRSTPDHTVRSALQDRGYSVRALEQEGPDRWPCRYRADCRTGDGAPHQVVAEATRDGEVRIVSDREGEAPPEPPPRRPISRYEAYGDPDDPAGLSPGPIYPGTSWDDTGPRRGGSAPPNPDDLPPELTDEDETDDASPSPEPPMFVADEQAVATGDAEPSPRPERRRHFKTLPELTGELTELRDSVGRLTDRLGDMAERMARMERLLDSRLSAPSPTQPPTEVDTPPQPTPQPTPEPTPEPASEPARPDYRPSYRRSEPLRDDPSKRDIIDPMG